MKKRRLGNTNLFVSEIALGGASIGNLYEAYNDEDARQTIVASWEGGIRYFDTAPEYGYGLSERRMGDVLRMYPRDELVLSTKVGEILYARHNELPPENKFIDKLPFFLRFDYSYDGVMRAFEDSLQRLGLNRVDIILVHDLDPIIHDEKTFQIYFKNYVENGYKALAELRDQGVVQAIGLGIKKWEVCAEAMKYGDYECFMLQGNYTLLEQPALHFLELCLQKNISILLAGPYASGILATGPVKGAYFHHREANDNVLKLVRKIQDICHAFQVPMQAVAIQFPLKHAAIASVVVGAASAALMRENLDYANVTIPNALWDALKSENIIAREAPT